jgi:hypothetical protein
VGEKLICTGAYTDVIAGRLPEAKMRIFSLVVGISLALLSQAGISYATNSYCSWETTLNSKKYNFNLLTSSGHPHGARSEDG